MALRPHLPPASSDLLPDLDPGVIAKVKISPAPAQCLADPDPGMGKQDEEEPPL